MQQVWFKKTGWVYSPVHVMGFIITAAAVVFMISIVIALDRSAHSVTDELYDLFVYGTCTAFWWKWVAEKTSI